MEQNQKLPLSQISPDNNSEIAKTEILDAESIIAKKIYNGKTYYKIKWSNNGKRSTPTWEPDENIIDRAIIYNHDSYANKEIIEEEDINPYDGSILHDKPLEIIRRISAKDKSGDYAVLVRWKVRLNGTEPNHSVVMLSELKDRYPQLVLKFYERALKFEITNNDSLLN